MAITQDLTLCDRFKLYKTREGLEYMVRRVRTEVVKSDCRGVMFAIETGGHYWRNVAYFLEEQGTPFRFMQQVRVANRRKYAPVEKVRIVLEGFSRGVTVNELCRREGIKPGAYYAWTKDFMEAGKEQLTRDTIRDATRQEIDDLKRENGDLKHLVPTCLWMYTVLKKRQSLCWTKAETAHERRGQSYYPGPDRKSFQWQTTGAHVNGDTEKHLLLVAIGTTQDKQRKATEPDHS